MAGYMKIGIAPNDRALSLWAHWGSFVAASQLLVLRQQVRAGAIQESAEVSVAPHPTSARSTSDCPCFRCETMLEGATVATRVQLFS
jgi:hypothetical protein